MKYTSINNRMLKEGAFDILSVQYYPYRTVQMNTIIKQYNRDKPNMESIENRMSLFVNKDKDNHCGYAATIRDDAGAQDTLLFYCSDARIYICDDYRDSLPYES